MINNLKDCPVEMMDVVFSDSGKQIIVEKIEPGWDHSLEGNTALWLVSGRVLKKDGRPGRRLGFRTYSRKTT